MSALPEYMIPIFATFAPVFSNPVWTNAQLLIIGAIVFAAPSRRPCV